MSLVAIQCQNCGGALQVDENAKSYYCPFCNTAYEMQQNIVQNFQTTNIGHIETANIIDDGSGKINQEIFSAEAYLRMRKYGEAQFKFQNLTGYYAHRYEAWWGLARAITEDFTREPSGKSDFIRVVDALDSALSVAPADAAKQIEMSKRSYCGKWQSYYEQLEATRSQQLNTIHAKAQSVLAPHAKKVEELKIAIEKKEARAEKVETFAEVTPWVAFIGIGLLIAILTYISGEGLITSVLGAALLAGLGIFLPLKIVFFFVKKAIRVPTDMMVNHNTAKIQQIVSEMEAKEQVFEEERNIVLAQTAWLDR